MSLNRKAIVVAVGAALAAPCAYAQTAGDKWEIYGKFYPEMTHTSGSGATPTTESVSTLAQPAQGQGAIIQRWEMQISNTYLGFRGEKNLGGGLKAIGQLETTVAIDEGGGTLGNRDSFAGLSGGWGTIRLGNMDTPFKKYGDTVGFLGVSSGNFVTPNNVMRRVSNSGPSGFNLRRANAIDFASANFGGMQIGVQYSIGNPTEASINPATNRNPRVVSMGIKWEQGPFYAAAAAERHFDLFGGSGLLSAAAPVTATTPNTANAGVNSTDTAVQLTGVYKMGVHALEVDWNVKKYEEKGATQTNNFQQYHNNAYEVVLESRWTNQWRTTLAYVKATAGNCTAINATCDTKGMGATQINAGVAYSFDPSTYLFALYSRLTNGSSARYNNTAVQAVNDGEDITQYSVGLAYSF